MFIVLFLILGVLFLLFNIFLFQGSSPKFKSDLPPTEHTKKRGIIKWFLISFAICLGALSLILWFLSHIL